MISLEVSLLQICVLFADDTSIAVAKKTVNQLRVKAFLFIRKCNQVKDNSIFQNKFLCTKNKPRTLGKHIESSASVDFLGMVIEADLKISGAYW